MRNVYTVKQVNLYIKNMFHTSGHIYFSLKDESGTIACIMFASARSGLSFRMREGQKVVVLGSVNVYERDGKYQLYANEIILEGAGLLYEKFEALKQELEEMGMFADEYKQPIPKCAKTVGIVTAPTGAAVRDIIQIASRRNPYVQLILYPALVQGEGAADSIVRGIRMMEKQNVDVMIVGRGGGSIEDLWAFNEEKVARAIFECRVPVISAVGHETDTLISDFVADLRAPTPSAAAELAVYDYRHVLEQMEAFFSRMRRQMRLKTMLERRRLEQLELRLKHTHPQQKLNENRQRLLELENRLRDRMQMLLEENKYRLAIYTEQIDGLSPLKKLSQGYSYTELADGENVRSVKQVKGGQEISVYVTDGKIKARIIEVEDGWKR